MKLTVLSYSHHGRSMARTAQGLGHEIVGVMDSETKPRQQLMDDFQCPGFETAGGMPRHQQTGRCPRRWQTH